MKEASQRGSVKPDRVQARVAGEQTPSHKPAGSYQNRTHVLSNRRNSLCALCQFVSFPRFSHRQPTMGQLAVVRKMSLLGAQGALRSLVARSRADFLLGSYGRLATVSRSKRVAQERKKSHQLVVPHKHKGPLLTPVCACLHDRGDLRLAMSV